MSDRLEDIKADWGYPDCEEGVHWLIAEIERLRYALEDIATRKSLSAPVIWRTAEAALRAETA